jgi:CheY-like chemotaxis protein
MEAHQIFIVVDDDSTNNLICKFAIQKASPGAAIQLFTEPEDALREIKENHEVGGPTLLFLDINMPSMTGWEFLEIFKEFDAETMQRFTIYILSSSIDDRDRIRANNNPLVSGFLSKPLNAAIVSSILAGEL